MQMASAAPRRSFYVWMAMVAAVTVFAGFAPTYYLKTRFGAPELSLLVHVHGLVFTAWMALFVAQTGLVAAGRVDLHRRLGIAAAIVALAMIILGTLTAIAAAKRGHTPIPAVPPLAFLATPLGDVFVFAALVLPALYLRRRTDFHKRLMLLATVSILGPAIARLHIDAIAEHLPFSYIALVALLVLLCAGWDWRATGRLHSAYRWGGGLVLLSHPLRLWLAGTATWLQFATWLTT